jgi:hypothetical protein
MEKAGMRRVGLVTAYGARMVRYESLKAAVG